MNARFIIIAILISIKVIGIASRAKAEINIKDLIERHKTTCMGLKCDEINFDKRISYPWYVTKEDINNQKHGRTKYTTVELDEICKSYNYRFKNECIDTWRRSL
ncbi:MAG: hypothetical protein O2916_11120 [Proteobacteria bacterium]|nr:hypothetical protein [Pseudomonadota bacterium]